MGGKLSSLLLPHSVVGPGAFSDTAELGCLGMSLLLQDKMGYRFLSLLGLMAGNGGGTASEDLESHVPVEKGELLIDL